MRHAALLWIALLCAPLGGAQRGPSVATIHVDAGRVENHVSPRMYASFVEMMAEDVKRGMTAEMLLNRSFEEPTDYLGLPAHWQLEPDERNDIVGAIKFQQTSDEAYP